MKRCRHCGMNMETLGLMPECPNNGGGHDFPEVMTPGERTALHEMIRKALRNRSDFDINNRDEREVIVDEIAAGFESLLNEWEMQALMAADQQPHVKPGDCLHPNGSLHPGRFDGVHTVCAKCKRMVVVSLAHYASGETADQQYAAALKKLRP